MPKTYILSGVVLAAVLWFVMFVIQPYNFWLMMSFSTTVLALLSFAAYGKSLINWRDFTSKNVLLGCASAAVLYGIFWTGNLFMRIVAGVLLGDDNAWKANLGSVYANAGQLPLWLVGLLLFFPIGCFEELFWRGAVQRYFQGVIDPAKAFALTLAIYTLIHVPTGNVALVLAAFTCGAFWGVLYWKTRSLAVVLVSHMLWDPFIFVVLPIR